jgi:hypothetical protein
MSRVPMSLFAAAVACGCLSWCRASCMPCPGVVPHARILYIKCFCHLVHA